MPGGAQESSALERLLAGEASTPPPREAVLFADEHA